MQLSRLLIAAALLLALGASPASAQCGGQFLPGSLCGNPGASTGLPVPTRNPVIGSATSPGSLLVTATDATAISVRSALGRYTAVGIGRTAEEGVFGVAGLANQFFTGTAAGDLVLKGTNSNKIWFGVGGLTPAGYINPSSQWVLGTAAAAAGSEPILTVSNNISALPTNPDPSEQWLLRVSAIDGKSTVVGFDSFGSGSFSALVFEQARGTNASKSAVQSGDITGVVDSHGYYTGGSSGYSGGFVQLRFYAAGNFSDTSQPGRASIWTTPTGSTALSLAEVARFDQDRSTTLFGALTAGGNTATLPTATGPIQFAAVNGSETVVTADTFGNGVGSAFIARSAQGTASAPTASQAGDILGLFGAIGRGAGAYSLTNAQVRFVANQTFTNAAQGARIDFLVTPNGSTGASIITAGAVENDGGLTWPRTVTGGSKGAGTINATALYVGGVAVVPTTAITNSIGGNVLLNNVALYFDGPSVAQGTTGTWFASGTVQLTDTAGAAQFSCKLWDGTTVIASAQADITVASNAALISLSGYLASPAGNIRVSCRDLTSTSGFIAFNGSGNSKDSTISAFRIN